MRHECESAMCSRRELLKMGAGGLTWGLFGLSLPFTLFVQEAQASLLPTNPLYDAMIGIFFGGGPPATDTFDPKPGSANNLFPTIALGANDIYGQPIQVTQLLTPFVDLINSDPASYGLGIVRSLTHISDAHDVATGFMNCFWQSPVADTYPSTLSVMSYYFQDAVSSGIGIPAVTIANERWGGNDAKGSTLPTALSASARGPLSMPSNVGATRYQLQQQMTNAVNQGILASCPDLAPKAVNQAWQQAYNITTQGKAASAFDLTGVPSLPGKTGSFTYDTYIDNLLLCQQLVKAGVPYISVMVEAPDSHQNGKTSIPITWNATAAAVPQLARNLKATGKRVLILMGGEFGRTPQVKTADGGRDHWPDGFTWAMLSINQPKFKTTAVGDTGPNGDWTKATGSGAGKLVDPIQPGTLGALVYKAMGFNVGVDSATDIQTTIARTCPVDRTMATVNAPVLMNHFGLA